MKHPRLPKNIECVPIGSLAPYARNARIHSPEQIGQIAASIQEFGWTSPILVAGKAKKSLQVVAGHGRLLAAAKIGMTEVPIIRLDHLTPTQIRAYIIADNKLTLNADWEDQTLAAELKALSDVGFDLSLTGFSDDEMKELLGEDESTMSAGCDEPDASKADECQAK
ncbi:MAG TPA: ParB/Srx family N-terminal domain-containing protein [Candidatus Paceibacterota bacterium]|nr:ParB/Srx family N-terminal domain-containing protein [Candidatus Paceibacterota bacterium]